MLAGRLKALDETGDLEAQIDVVASGAEHRRSNWRRVPHICVVAGRQ